MVCGEGPSVGAKVKQAGRDIEDAAKDFVSDPTTLLVGPQLLTAGGTLEAGASAAANQIIPKPPGPQGQQVTPQQGFTEEDKRNLRRRQGFQQTRLSGLLTDATSIARPSLLGFSG